MNVSDQWYALPTFLILLIHIFKDLLGDAPYVQELAHRAGGVKIVVRAVIVSVASDMIRDVEGR